MSSLFAFSTDAVATLADAALARAKERGASDAAAEVSESVGLSVSTRKMKVETIEHTRDKGLSVTVYMGGGAGTRRTSDFAAGAIHEAVDAAYNIARFTAEDGAAGLPDDDTFERAPRDLDLFHPWDIDTDEGIRIAQACERAAFAVSPQIVNSEGANVYTSSGHFVLANTRGFVGAYPYSRHSISVSPIARDANGMQRDDWYTASRVPGELATPERVGDYAAAPCAGAPFGAQAQDAQGARLVRSAAGLWPGRQLRAGGEWRCVVSQASFLVDALDKPLFADHISVHEDLTRRAHPGRRRSTKRAYAECAARW